MAMGDLVGQPPTSIPLEDTMRRFQFSTCVIVVAAMLLALVPSGRASAQDGPEVVFDPEQSTKAIGINNLTIDGTIYNVTFTIVQRAAETYGAFPGVYEFTTEESAAVAVDAVAAVLTEAEVHVVGADEGEDFPSFRIGFKGFEDALGIALVRIWEAGINFKGAWNRFAHDDTLIYNDDMRTWATFTVVGDAPPDVEGHTYFVPSASHSAGAMGSFWVTDVEVNNGGDDTATYKFSWLPRKADNSSPTMSEEFTLEPGEAVRFEDVVLSVFDVDDASGALAVVSDSNDLFIFSRTYNDTDVGTFGTALPGVAEDDLVQGDIRKRLLFFTENSDFRSNIAFQNGTGSNLRVTWERYLADGTMVESGTTDLLPYSNKQLNAIYQDEAPVEAAYMDVWTDDAGGKFMVFSSVVDNGTSDGTIVQPQW